MNKLVFSLLTFNFFVLNNVLCGEVTEASYKTNRISLPTKCANLLEEFAQIAANFTLCSILNARPITLCEKCVTNYVQFSHKYHELLNTADNGTLCATVYLSQDRLEAVKEYHDNILNVWDKGNCNECFNWTSASTFPEISNKTKKFNRMFAVTFDCIKKNMNENKETVCEKCKQFYLELDEFYKSMSKDSIGVQSVCMDVVDSMNTTRSLWSKTLECCKIRNNPEIVFFCCTALISLLPILFYISMRYCGPIRNLQNVLKQTRFKQTFLRSRNQ